MRRFFVAFLLFLPILIASFILYLQTEPQRNKNNVKGTETVDVSAFIGGFPTDTPTPTPTNTPTPTPIVTSTPGPTATPGPSPTPTPTPTASPTPTAGPSPTVGPSPTITPTPYIIAKGGSPTPTFGPTPILTPTPNVPPISRGGVHRFSLYGYTSPFAQVSLEGVGIAFQSTTADKTGYFSFANNFSPILPQEACLTAKDQLGRVSSPTCLPSFPLSYDINIGPVLLPPTLSINKPEHYAGEEIIISGQTIPNTDVILSIFVDSQKTSIVDYLATDLNPIKSVYAFDFPGLQTKTDSKGNYSLGIPSSKSDLFRLFTRSVFNKQSTPQSNKLILRISPIWWLFLVNLFIWLWLTLQPYLLETIIILQTTFLLIYFVRHYLLPHRLASERALMILEKHPITII